MNYDDLDHLDSLISEDFISEDEDCGESLDYSPTNLHSLGSKDKLNQVTKSLQSTPDEDIEMDHPDSPQITYESDSSQTFEPAKTVNQSPKMTRKAIVSRLREVPTPAKSSTNEIQTLTLPPSRALLPSNSTLLVDSKRDEDYSMLENKINDSLLDVLRGKLTKTLPKAVENYPAEEKPDDSLKFINIFPSEVVRKTINLMVKGKTCRSKQLLNATEMRIVSRIVNQENMFGSKSGYYKNVYYDPESDSNIRYDVTRRMLTEFNSSPPAMMYVNKKVNPKSLLIRKAAMKTGFDESKLARNRIARTRIGRISRPRPVIKDYKRLKYTSELNNEVDENENTGGHSDYDMDEDVVMSDDDGGRELEKRDPYVPLESTKRQFSPLSICPTCHGVYVGYRRMAIHFQKYPHHRDDELLQILKNRKELYYDPCDEPTRAGQNVCRNSNPSQVNSFNKKSKPNSKSHPRLRSPAVCIKELLSRFGTKEIAKYAGPVVAETMNSWEYLRMRAEKLKSGDGTLLISLLKELKVILAQIQALSSHALEPLTKENQTCSNKLTIGPKDVLQHVLGVQPGMYVISDSKSAPGASSVQKQNTSLSLVNAGKPQNAVQSNSTTAKLFDAVVAECLRDESSDMNSNATQLNQKIDPNYQNMAALVYNEAVDGQASGINKVPIFTTNELPMSTSLVIPQTVQPVNDVNAPLLLDFSIFDDTPSSTPQLSSQATELGSASLIENDSRTQNTANDNVPLSLPSLMDDIDESKQPCSDTNVILDFSLLE